MKIEKNGDQLLLSTENDDESTLLAAFMDGGKALALAHPTATHGRPALSLGLFTGCAAKAIAEKQPAFTVIAQDKLAAPLVDLWADLAELHGCAPEKVADAREKAKAMAAYPYKKFPD